MNKKELEKMKEELRRKIEEAKSVEELNQLEVEKRKLEMVEVEEDTEITEQEERKLVKETELIKVRGEKEEKEEEKSLSNILKSKEYRTAWAKKLMGLKLNKVEERTLGDAITTTATDFVESTDTVQGINNGGLFIPTDVRLDMLRIIEETSPFLRDCRKLAVAGNIEMPYLNAADDAEWYAELTDTKNEGQEYKKLSLTGYELAKQIEITWKLEAMTVEAFLSFITKELADKMGRALATAVLYGDGDGKPTGALTDLTAVTGEEVIATMINTYASLSNDMKIGAKAYLSNALAISIVGYKDNNGNYPYLQGLKATALFDIEVDPFLEDADMVVGNPQNYVLNTVEGISVNRETKVTQRRNVYSTYAIYDGKPYPDAFAKGNVAEA